MGHWRKRLGERQLRTIATFLTHAVSEAAVMRIFRLTAAELAELRRDPDYRAYLAEREALNRLSLDERRARIVAKAHEILETRLRDLDLGDAPKH
jgi:hypothetical protein